MHLPPPERTVRVYCNQAQYGPVYVGSAEARVKVIQEVVGSGHTGFGGDVDGASGGGTDGTGVGDRWDG